REHGGKALSVDDQGVASLSVGDTSSPQEKNYVGVGIYKAPLDEDGRAKARAIVKLLCREDIQSDSTYQRSLISDAPSGFSLHCTR
ncbi:hypothetical protein, partial [Dyella sp. ASV21]|uniref:hypothetical protein n=1 Tax=Dyella sp. ASV21 TaxID=2795114 RepID=UPI001E4202B2